MRKRWRALLPNLSANQRFPSQEMQRAIDATSADPGLLLSGPDPFAKADRLISGYWLTGCPG
jgi:hypothetical protein